MTREQILPIAYGLAVLVALVMLPLQHRAYRLLRTRHRIAYERLGRPGWANASAWWSRGYWGWVKFLYARRYAELQDPELSQIARWLLVLNAILYCAAIALIFASSCTRLC
jgi:hypothetical protein